MVENGRIYWCVAFMCSVAEISKVDVRSMGIQVQEYEHEENLH